MKEKIRDLVLTAVKKVGVQLSPQDLQKINTDYPDFKFGDYSTNAALILAKETKMSPMDLATKIVEKIDEEIFEKVEVIKPGFINFRLKTEQLITYNLQPTTFLKREEKILLEYFQPNIAKPLHVGHLETAIIGDALKRMIKYQGINVESDTHMGDWGTQFGVLILAYRKYGDPKIVEKDPINELNKLYIKINQEIEQDKSFHELAKQEFVKLEQGDKENRKIWKQFVDWSMEKFLTINDLMDILPFDHHWPESFYEDKMPAVLEELKAKGLLKESQGAQIVDLSAIGGSAYGGEDSKNLGVAVIVKSDDGTTYLLRDLATFIFSKQQGFIKHLYVVDNRQSHHYRQLFAILKLMGEIEEGEGAHIDYGFISFKGEALSTRKGNMVLATDIISQAEEKVKKIIEEKNPDLKNKTEVIKAVTKSALKYFILKHNRHSDIEFDWEEVLDFEGDSGPYLQYAYARLSSILRKAEFPISNFPASPAGGQFPNNVSMTNSERELLFKLSILPEIVEDALKDYMPNVLANYLYNLATLINKFYHESPVTQEPDENKKAFRITLISATRNVLKQGLNLLGIKELEEM